jgi:hypothetical protein
MGRIQGRRPGGPRVAAQIGGKLARDPAPDPREDGQTQEASQNRMLRYSSTLRIPIAS